jgi:hypothetical protein
LVGGFFLTLDVASLKIKSLANAYVWKSVLWTHWPHSQVLLFQDQSEVKMPTFGSAGSIKKQKKFKEAAVLVAVFPTRVVRTPIS